MILTKPSAIVSVKHSPKDTRLASMEPTLSHREERAASFKIALQHSRREARVAKPLQNPPNHVADSLAQIKMTEAIRR
jgi:hypothetical protein